MQGFVLAGGESRRFGSDKGLALFQGRPLIQWALTALRGLDSAPRVVTRDPSPYRGLASAFVTGESPGGGPIEGLRASLASTTAPWSLVVSVDMPGVNAHVLEVLVQGRDEYYKRKRGAAPGGTVRTRPVVFTIGDRMHPFPGLYPGTLLGACESLGPGASMHRLLEVAGVVKLDSDRFPRGTDPAPFFRNVNTPRDLE